MPTDTLGNSFLESLSQRLLKHLQGSLVKILLKPGQILAEAEAPIERIIFPAGSVISSVAAMADGRPVAVGIVGHDGFTSLPIAFHSHHHLHTSIVQVPGYAYSLGAAQFVQLIEQDKELKERVLSYAAYAYLATAQLAACNGLHCIEERYTRWILMSYDRVGLEEFLLTQDFVAHMLGVRRPSISLVAGRLSKSESISYNRGLVRIIDASKLESNVCECYRVLSKGMNRAMGYPARRPADSLATP